MLKLVNAGKKSGKGLSPALYMHCLGARTLENLSRRKSVVELRSAMPEVTETELLDELTRLMQQQKLIFEERERYPSLVLGQKTSWGGDQLLIEQAATAV